MKPRTCSETLQPFPREVWNQSNFSDARISSENPSLSQNLSGFFGRVIKTKVKASV